ncbi:hypothetical protein BJ878DRAFT_517964 [Calycina marina]|uniref:Uncharacterized protein n=1 Tax=Calycina marina TaxID=1763456 RepID=A0A9P8CE58_9HELO|nr:hypothetical protein BJ878DRAFT_517964 [Calycina marina]
MVEITKLHFAIEERRQKHLTEWRSTTLLQTIQENPGLLRLECLEMVLDRFRTTQKGLATEYLFEHSLRDHVLNACQGLRECSAAQYKQVPTFEGLCTVLPAAIGTMLLVQEQ